MATIKEQDIVLVSKELDGTKVIQMPITRVENVEGGIATVNGIKPDSSKNVAITKVDQATSANRAIDADKAVKAIQDGNGRIIAITYATKDELATKLDVDSAFTKTTADSLYLGKTDTAVAATKALQDNLGNKISDTYATKSALSNGLLPLATLAKDSEVLKLIAQSLTPEQKAQVLKNLEGTFLPLSGGTVKGQILLGNSLNGLIQTNHEVAQFSGNSGSEVDIWSKGSQYEGTITIIGRDSRSGKRGQLNVAPNHLAFDGKDVERVADSNAWYTKYESGLMIQFGINVIQNNIYNHTFLQPFISNQVAISATYFGDSSLNSSISIIANGGTGFTARAQANWGFLWMAIGRWK